VPLYTVNAIVLKRINLGETDRIVTMLSREKGKIAGVAKGSRKAISRLSGASEVFICARYQLATGRNLDVITQVDIRESFPRIHSDLFRIAYTAYLIEVVDRFTDDEEYCPNLFDLLLSTLFLMERPNDPEIVSRMFDLQFMREIGYEPVLDMCLRCSEPLGEANNAFSPSLGGMVCRKCGYLPDDSIPLSDESRNVMIQLLNADASELEQISISKTSLDQIGRAMRWYVRFRAERDLKSMEFLQTIKLGRCNEESGNSGNI
jgi:DNA repair protein RecO (recombination protein O)